MESLMTRRALVAASALIACALVGPLAGLAHAHAIVARTQPGIDQVVEKSPSRVVIYFNEPVEIAFGAVRVFDTNGNRVDDGTAAHLGDRADAIAAPLQPHLPKGTYTVAWRVVSSDGHPVEEAFVFHVREPGEQPQGIASKILRGEGGSDELAGALLGTARWLNFLSLVVLVGGLGFLALVWSRRERHRVPPEMEGAFARRSTNLLVASWSVALIASIVSLPLQAAVAGQLPLSEAVTPRVLGSVMSTRFGIVTAVKLVLLGLLALLWLASRLALSPQPARSVGAAARRPEVAAWVTPAAVLLALGLLATPGLSGHAGSTPPVAVSLAVDITHLAGVSLWIGGLVFLLFAALPAGRKVDTQHRVGALAPLVARFSDLAVIAVAIIAASGLYAAWVQVRALGALTSTTYGVVLLTKLAVFLPLLALGAINNRFTKPRLEQAAGSVATDGGPLATLRKLVATEVALALAVLAITALLVNLPPARLDAGVSGPFIANTRMGNLNLNVVIDPNEVGSNIMHLTATKASGNPAPVRAMRALLRMPEQDIGPLVVEGHKLARGHFAIQGRQLSVPGTWTMTVVARTGRFQERRARVTFEVRS